MGWLAFSSYERWVAKSAAVTLLPGPAYVPAECDETADGDRGERVGGVEGSPSKHTRHGTAYSSYSVGKGLLGRIPSSRFYQPLPSTAQDRTKSSEKSSAWRSLPSSSRARTNNSTRSTQTATVNPDDPFTSIGTGTDTKSQTVIVASRTSTRSTFAHASRFGEVWSDEEDQDAVVVSPFGPTLPAEGEGEKAGFLKRIRSQSKSAKGKKRDEKSTSTIRELASPVKETSPRKNSWKFPWTPGSPSAKPDSYTAVPTRMTSPRSQSFRTPQSSPRKPSYVRSGEKVRSVDTSILPASPPTLTSPRLESEFFLSALVFDVPGTPTPKRTRLSRAVTGRRRDEERDDTDTLITDAASPSPPGLSEFEHTYESHFPTKYDPRPGPSRHLSTTSISTISEFPGDPPPKRTPAERFYARRSALDKVEEIIQRSRSQTSVANAATGHGRSSLDTIEEHRRFGRVGREFESGGIEQRLFEP